MLALLGLKDDYVHDGRVLTEWMEQRALPSGIRQHSAEFIELAEAYKQLNAPLGELGRASLLYANRSVTDTDKAYTRYLAKSPTSRPSAMRWPADQDDLDGAAFGNQPVKIGSEISPDIRARELIERIKILAAEALIDDDHH